MTETIKTLPVIDGGPYSKCTKRQRLFVDEYLASRTAASAYIAAGYKGENPTDAAWMLLKKPLIRDAITERRAQLLDDVGLRQERVLCETYAIATSDPRRLENELGEVVPLHLLDAKTAAAIKAVEIEDVSIGGRVGKRYKYQFWDKPRALDKLGQWMKLWESAHASINIDNRRVEVHSASDPRSEATLRAVNDLIGAVRALGEGLPAPKDDPNGSLLPAAVRDAPQGHGAPVVAGEDSGDPEPT
jgi:phage terminase small subunit